MKSIHTLIPDIYERVQKPGWFTDELAEAFAKQVSKSVQSSLNDVRSPYLRMSGLGPMCPKALWHSINTPELREQLPPWSIIKYTYGHMLEALVLALAKGAGHDVIGEQDELVLDDVPGHRDAVVDGCVVDVKSSSSRSMDKLRSGTLGQDDPFGYLDQLDGYVVASSEDPLVHVKDRGYILGIDNLLGHLELYEHKVREKHIRDRIASHRRIISLESPPPCACGTKPMGESGNIQLDTKASYSLYKHTCFPHLRTFIYSKGPVYLTKVVKRPTYQGQPLQEIDRNGKVVYN